MDILDYAIQMEKDGERFYRELAGKSPDAGLADILTRLADAELKHQEVLQQMKEARTPRPGEGTIRSDIRNLFAQMLEAGTAFEPGMPEVELYREAQDIEVKSRDFYRAKADEMGSAEGKAVLMKLADEEAMHYQILASMVEFVSRPTPGNWLENAEWHHAEEY